MKIAISNIIWPKGEENFEEFLKTSQELGFDAVELALNCIWEEPIQTNKVKFDQLKELLLKYGLEISALHSVTYTRPDLEFFATNQKKEELIDYIKRYIDISLYLGCKNIVYGSPTSRRKNNKPTQVCEEIFLDSLSQVDLYCNRSVIFNIEPLNSKICEFINSMREAKELLVKRKFNSIGIQLDIRNCIENGETPEDYLYVKEYVHHCQVGNPGLTIPGDVYLSEHLSFSSVLRQSDYNGFVAGEILSEDKDSYRNNLKKAFSSLNQIYGSSN
ncbi:sugar phosphate isomerase/epimerase family protein [Leptospira vanthielii]|uniref:Sugar phosphate isomerase/epimerase n=1 Tax=Leptospira vanthielii TaxID=293085 RepID=A0ABY2NSS5_9LEPT|nr:TIM barrel protein [Leptospira vanthielii]TGM60678.1 sugar phosphate isomerase/epimerase [Leptospira vanthielii]